ncbi:hypothetical protein THAOC_19409 [Thalassiosira oceanica]|uniref:Uncharacterized protein n=1 Tax=Thalassiosira oceanica TaxID=159749 RepID=K0SH10_THAOC|nr:hypothetical protein THAOC_19409 [Thalassiosira oceanica]|eukprot:EJK60271.1 hypothetical protein THAOC_19409 [Thalassiosira oceanica]
MPGTSPSSDDDSEPPVAASRAAGGGEAAAPARSSGRLTRTTPASSGAGFERNMSSPGDLGRGSARRAGGIGTGRQRRSPYHRPTNVGSEKDQPGRLICKVKDDSGRDGGTNLDESGQRWREPPGGEGPARQASAGGVTSHPDGVVGRCAPRVVEPVPVPARRGSPPPAARQASGCTASCPAARSPDEEGIRRSAAPWALPPRCLPVGCPSAPRPRGAAGSARPPVRRGDRRVGVLLCTPLLASRRSRPALLVLSGERRLLTIVLSER